MHFEKQAEVLNDLVKINNDRVEGYKKAIENLEIVCEDSDFGMIAKALFNLARLQESKGDVATAIETYNTLISRNPSDEWAKLAKSKVMFLELN